jgi:hypothetical protein
VEGDIASPIDIEKLRTSICDHLLVDEKIAGVAVAPDRENRGVLEEEQIVIGRPTGYPTLMKRSLQIPSLCIGKPTEPTSSKPRRQASSCSQSQVSRFS